MLKIRGFSEAEDVDASVVQSLSPTEIPLPHKLHALPDAVVRTSWANAMTFDVEGNADLTSFAYDVAKVAALGGEVENLTPAVVSLDLATGQATGVGVGGLARIAIEAGDFSQHIVRKVGLVPKPDSYWTVQIEEFKPGTLGRHMWEVAESLIAGKTPSASTRELYLNNNAGTSENPTAIRNPNCFAASMDLTPISCYNGTSRNARPGLLISRRHIWSAKHFPTLSPVVWIDNQGEYQTANVVRYKDIPDSDIRIQYLDRALPESVSHFRGMPERWAEAYVPCINASNLDDRYQLENEVWGHSFSLPTILRALPVFTKGANFGNNPLWIEAQQVYYPENGGMTATSFVTSGDRKGYAYGTISNTGGIVPVNGPARKFYDWGTHPVSGSESMQGGDSGSPTFCWIDGIPVLIGCRFYPSSAPGPDEKRAAVNAAMNELRDPGDTNVYSIEEVDLSRFTRFS